MLGLGRGHWRGSWGEARTSTPSSLTSKATDALGLAGGGGWHTGLGRVGAAACVGGDCCSPSLALSLPLPLLMAFRGNHLQEAIFCCSKIKAQPGVSPSLDNEDESQPGLPRKNVN